MQETEAEQQAKFETSPYEWRFHVGQWVKITTKRPNVEQYHQAIGQIQTITNQDIIYVVIKGFTPCFHRYELQPVQVPGEKAT